MDMQSVVMQALYRLAGLDADVIADKFRGENICYSHGAFEHNSRAQNCPVSRYLMREVVAEGIGGPISVSTISKTVRIFDGHKYVTIDVPESVTQFVNGFDNHRYDHLFFEETE